MIDVLKPMIKQFMPFAKERMGFESPPRLFLKRDQTNAQNPLGKTAYYDPEQKSVTLYITGRHPKDVMRSLSHELVHHTQNCNGKFDQVGQMGDGYAQNDEHLREMEREAYEQGNLCFRDWEDSIKHTIYFEHLQKGANNMSNKKWKNKELNSLLAESWGFNMNFDNLNEEAKPDYLDLDKDGDKEESMKQAAEQAEDELLESEDIMDTDMPRMDVSDLSLSDYELSDIETSKENAMDQIFYASDVNKEKMRKFLNMYAAEEGVEPFDLLVNMGFAPQVASNIMGMLGEMDQAKMGMTFSERRVRRRDREGMETDIRRRPMEEAKLRRAVREALKKSIVKR